MNDEQYIKDIGSRIKAARKSNKLSQEAMAKRLQRSKQLASAWEKGRAQISAYQAVRLSQALNVSVEWLLTGVNAK